VAYFSVTLDAKELNDSKGEEQRNNPSGVINVFDAGPIMNDLAAVRFCFRKNSAEELTLQAAEISKGRTVSHPIPYCQPQAKPQEGSINRQIYMVKAPLMGYMTANSASACIMR
jgi:hypothetical protein